MYLVSKKAYLDKLAGSIVRSRGKCQNPNCRTPFSYLNPPVWSHIIPRGCLHLRWLMENALCLCLECEKYFTNHPLEQRKLFISIIGEEKFWELKIRQNQKEYVDYAQVATRLRKIMTKEKLNIYMN